MKILKIVILIILACSVGASILINILASGVGLGMGLVGGTVGGFIGIFVACASGFLIWVAWPIGWEFAVDNGFKLLGRLIFGFLSIVISLPIAILILFKPNY